MVEEERRVVSEVFPLVPSSDVGGLADWLVRTLGLKESWRHAEGDFTEHAEVIWPGGRVSINRLKPGESTGHAQVALRVDDRSAVETLFERAQQAGAEFQVPLAETPVAYSFTARDPEGNLWWVSAETGFLDKLRTVDP